MGIYMKPMVLQTLLQNHRFLQQSVLLGSVAGRGEGPWAMGDGWWCLSPGSGSCGWVTGNGQQGAAGDGSDNGSHLCLQSNIRNHHNNQREKKTPLQARGLCPPEPLSPLFLLLLLGFFAVRDGPWPRVMHVAMARL